MAGITSPRKRVFVARELHGDALDRVREIADVTVWPDALPPDRDALVRETRDVDGLISLLTDRVDEELVRECKALRVVANVAVGTDNLDLTALTNHNIVATNTPDVLTDATADLTWALILAVARRIVPARDFVRDGQWKTWDPKGFLGLELSGATLGIVGLGRIGRAVATRAQGFSMRVLGYSRSGQSAPGVELVGLDELLGSADVVSLHCALTPETRHLIGAAQLQTMQPSSILINTARGGVVDEDALISALANRRISAAGLDVTALEPIPMTSPLLALENCLVLPHIGSATSITRAWMTEIACENVIAVLQGERAPNCVNPAVYGG